MDHLLDFPNGSQNNYETKLPDISKHMGQVPFEAHRRSFTPDDFDSLTEGHVSTLINKGPGEILRLNLSNTIPGFLQSWLFFSLLARVLNTTIDVKLFVKNNSKNVHTSQLRRLLQDWRSREQKEGDDEEERKERLISVDLSLNEASAFITQWCDRLDVDWKISPILWLSFAILGETLTRARLKIFPEFGVPDWGAAHERRWGRSKWLEDKVTNRGWCPSITHMIQSTSGSLSGLYVAGALDSPNAYNKRVFSPSEENVHKESEENFHKECSNYMCTAHIVDQTEFPLHSTTICKLPTLERKNVHQRTCRSLQLDPRKVEEIIQRGNIPLLSLDLESFSDGNGSEDLQECIQLYEYQIQEQAVVPFSSAQNEERDNPLDPETSDLFESESNPESRFVAVSHVWSDGLGNPKGNTLHQCQVMELQEMVDDLYRDRGTSHILFWLDTLCVPRSTQLRKAAIRKMNEVYKYAEKVLVLDQGLQEFDNNNGLEPMIRINMSKWARRLWTLQEGTLGNELYFRFRNGLLLESKEIQRKIAAAEQNLHLCWVGIAHLFNPGIRSLKDPSADNRIADLWQAVQWRTSQKLEDETICLATLLNLDPDRLLNPKENGDIKMCHFMSMLDEDENMEIPSGMIFLPGPKLDVEGFRWAPKTWMASVQNEYPYPLRIKMDGTTFLTTNGILVQHEGIRLRLRARPEGNKFWVATDATFMQWYLVEKAIDDCRYPDEKADDVWSKVLSHKKLAIITSHKLPKTRPEIALLVSIVRERKTVKWVHSLHRVWLSQEDRMENTELRSRFMKRDPVDGSVGRGEKISADQHWCVDGPPPTPQIVEDKAVEIPTISSDIQKPIEKSVEQVSYLETLPRMDRSSFTYNVRQKTFDGDTAVPVKSTGRFLVPALPAQLHSRLPAVGAQLRMPPSLPPRMLR